MSLQLNVTIDFQWSWSGPLKLNVEDGVFIPLMWNISFFLIFSSDGMLWTGLNTCVVKSTWVNVPVTALKVIENDYEGESKSHFPAAPVLKCCWTCSQMDKLSRCHIASYLPVVAASLTECLWSWRSLRGRCTLKFMVVISENISCVFIGLHHRFLLYLGSWQWNMKTSSCNQDPSETVNYAVCGDAVCGVCFAKAPLGTCGPLEGRSTRIIRSKDCYN